MNSRGAESRSPPAVFLSCGGYGEVQVAQKTLTIDVYFFYWYYIVVADRAV